jgi:hypothetical protein
MEKKHVKKVVNVSVPFGGLLVPLKEIVMKTKMNWLFGKVMLSSVGALIINMPNISEPADEEVVNTILEVDGHVIHDYYDFFHLEILKKIKNNSVIVPYFTQGHGVIHHSNI